MWNDQLASEAIENAAFTQFQPVDHINYNYSYALFNVVGFFWLHARFDCFVH